MLENRNPNQGPKPAEDAPTQPPPGVEAKLMPKADHGEESYQGSGKLDGLAAVITGGDSGIGRAVAIAFAREGADVAIGYLSEMEEEDARETRRWVEEVGRRCLTHRFDVGDRSACDEFVGRVLNEFGRIDILVNNAAEHTPQTSITDIGPEQLERTFRTNIFGYFYMTQAVMPHLKAGGVILNTGSVVALQGNAALLDYSATKGAIHTFTKSLAQQVSDQGIRVNCVAPGPVWTPLIASSFDQEHLPKFGADTRWGRPAQPVELAPAYVFLASAGARYITGEVLGVTGESTTR